MLLRFLDIPHLELENKTEMLHNVKPVALLIYLACQPDFVTREALTVLFAEDSSDTDALRQVRVLLSRARKFSWANGLKLEQNRLRFDVETDVQLFRIAIGATDWQRANELYKSEFLTGFRVDAQGFEAWCDTEREVLRTAWYGAALKHARALGADGQHGTASTLLRKVLASDELCEDVLAAFLEHCYLAGMRNEALKAFERFQDQLSTELGLEPLQSTLELVQTIRLATPLEVTRASRPGKLNVPISILRPPVMIGRDTERFALETAQEKVILVSGEPGAGKTRLLEEVMPDARRLSCLEGLENLAYQPLIAFLRLHLEQLPDLGVYTEDLARLIPELLPNTSLRSDDPISAKARLLEALARCFEAEQKPVLIDDLQWADASSLEFCHFLVSRGRVRMIGAYRSSEVSPALAKTISAWRSSGSLFEIKLEPLKPENVNALLASLTGVEVGPPRFSAWLSRTSGGNPFFALETLKALFETDMLHEKDGIWQSQLDDISFDYNELRVPSKVAAVIEQRISRLSEAARRAVQAASVMRQGFAPKMLSSIIGLSELATLDALEEAQSSSLIASDFFLHDLIRQGVYQSLPEARRRFLHGKVAGILENVAEPLIVAEHWLEANENARAIPKLMEAARLHQQHGLHSDAIRVMQLAIEIMPNDEIRLETQIKLAEALLEADHFDAADELLDLLLENCQDFAQKAKLLYIQADVFLVRDRVPDAIHSLEQALKLVENLKDQHSDQRFRITKGKLAFLQGNRAEALGVYQNELERMRTTGTLYEFASVLGDLGTIYEKLGEYEQSLTLFQESFEISKRIGARHQQVARACGIMLAHIRLGHPEAGIELGEETLKLGWFRDSDTLRNNLIAAHNHLGHHDEVMYHSAIVVRESPDPRFRAAAWSRMAKRYQSTNPMQVHDALEQALENLEVVSDHTALAAIAINVIEIGNEMQQSRAFELLGRVDAKLVSVNLQQRIAKTLASRVTS